MFRKKYFFNLISNYLNIKVWSFMGFIIIFIFIVFVFESY